MEMDSSHMITGGHIWGSLFKFAVKCGCLFDFVFQPWAITCNLLHHPNSILRQNTGKSFGNCKYFGPCVDISQFCQFPSWISHQTIMSIILHDMYTVGNSRSMGRLHNKCACLNDSARITTHTYLNIYRQTQRNTHALVHTHTHTHTHTSHPKPSSTAVYCVQCLLLPKTN